MVHLLRHAFSDHITTRAVAFDDIIRNAAERIAHTGTLTQAGQIQLQAKISRDGGFGFRSMRKMAPGAFLAAWRENVHKVEAAARHFMKIDVEMDAKRRPKSQMILFLGDV